MDNICKYISLCLLVGATNLFAKFEVNAKVGLNSQVYLIAPSEKHQQNFTAVEELEIKYIKDNVSIYSKIYAQEDSYDFSRNDAQHNKRTFARLDELYFQYDFENDMLSAGKDIRFWGALEVRNIVDAFNPQDFRTDIFNGSKLGVYNIAYTHYTQNGEFSLILKLDEADQPMAALPFVYYFFPSFVSYDGKVHETTERYRPSIFLKYSGSTDTEYALDYAFIYENGYDSQRYFITDTPQRLKPTAPDFAKATEFKQYAYIVNKFMTYNTLVLGGTLVKFEALYVKVDNNAYIGDYSHIGLGVEHTIENFMQSEAGLGLLCEYYKYDTYENDKYSDLELFETMQNDLFLGLRYSLNNANNTNILTGVITDLEYDEQVYYAKFTTRLNDSFVVDADYYFINPSTETKLALPTAYQFLGRHQRVGLNVSWYY